MTLDKLGAMNRDEPWRLGETRVTPEDIKKIIEHHRQEGIRRCADGLQSISHGAAERSSRFSSHVRDWLQAADMAARHMDEHDDLVWSFILKRWADILVGGGAIGIIASSYERASMYGILAAYWRECAATELGDDA